MKQRVLYLALAAAAAAFPVLAQPEPLHPPYTEFVKSNVRTSCAFLSAWCAGATPAQILAEAMKKPPMLGTCYAHDDRDGSGYPYAAHFYVKQSWRSDQKGFDGGTGAIGWDPPEDYETAREMAGQVLKDLCSQGECCCPVLPAKLPCMFSGPATAYDPITGTCCKFENLCTVPSTWSPILSPTDHRCD